MEVIKNLDSVLRSFERGYDLYQSGVRDLDFEWFGCDRNGRLAIFATGVQLDAAPQIIDCREEYLAAVRWILALPARGQSVPSQPGLWFDYGSRGLCGYDVPQPRLGLSIYEREYLPSIPLGLDESSGQVRAYFERVRLDSDFFEDLLVVADPSQDELAKK